LSTRTRRRYRCAKKSTLWIEKLVIPLSDQSLANLHPPTIYSINLRSFLKLSLYRPLAPSACNKMFRRLVLDVLVRNTCSTEYGRTRFVNLTWTCYMYTYLTSIDRKKCREQLWQLQLQLCAMAFFSLLFYSCVHTAVDLRHLSMY
jgi:hypothetical protein